MKICVLTETRAGERRVALVPDIVAKLVTEGWDLVVQSGAGAAANFPDDAYVAAGATLAQSATAALEGAAVIAKVNAPTAEEAAMFPKGSLCMSFLQPGQSVDALKVLAANDVTAVSFDLLPRISRAQSMDALSSQATVSGYRAALSGAEYQTKFFPLIMTAAGTVPPAKVLVMGVGVAGLRAIATARSLGAVVRAYDVRAAAKEEAESLGAQFVDLGVSAEGTGGYARELTQEEQAAQQAALAAEVAASDVVITTAAVPGRKAPILVTTAAIEAMGPGAVVIDMAADGGGNCEPTVAGEVTRVNHALLVGMTNPPSQMPTHASFLFARNVYNLLALFGKAGEVAPDWHDEVVTATAVVRHGTASTQAFADLLGIPVAVAPDVEEPVEGGAA
ncbi:MAG: NAD(P) transhydrogenase subunit alpha [Actinomycetota bacterium]